MQKEDYLTQITSTEEEYEEFYKADHIFTVQGRELDDENLLDVVNDLKYIEWVAKLRKTPTGHPKVQNSSNNHDWTWGYVIVVNSENLFNFERDALMNTIKHGYKFNKLDIGPTIKEENQIIFNNLFEEVV